VTLVPMTTAHIDLLMPYERAMFGPEAWTARGYRDELADATNRHYVAVEDAARSLLGWAGVLVIGDTAQILTVGVVPSARRRGLARLMLAGLYAEAVDRGAVEMMLEVRVDNESAQSLYRAERFVEIARRRGYYDQGRVDAVVMRREL
jgi:[ribosomal protein S18]-alanine N-acetyltransferase